MPDINIWMLVAIWLGFGFGMCILISKPKLLKTIVFMLTWISSGLMVLSMALDINILSLIGVIFTIVSIFMLDTFLDYETFDEYLDDEEDHYD